MKPVCLTLLALPFFAFSQTEKGVIPTNAKSEIQNPKSVRAVVIGISNYQDDAIPDLRFADRDAEAFAAWLRSSAGGSLPDASVKLLLNKDATTGKIIAALDGLISASKSGDEVVIYFSGHGDVERVTKFQRGYWLTWDSPPTVYAAGAFSLVFLQDVITTLSDAGVQVVVVSDACRAGKLAGSEFGGAQATSAALAQQFANEIKILSCQPDEFSLEGEQWGGGRGAFSYHLVDALYGMADANADGTVNLLEVGRYLEDKVPTETAPHSQIPFTVGSKSARIASVDAAALAEWRKKKTNNDLILSKIDSKGLEDLALVRADSSIRKLYAEFNAALQRGDLLTASSGRRSANELFEQLKNEPALGDLQGLMRRNFAAALMDEGQQFLNKLLKNNPKTIDSLWRGKVDAGAIAQQMARAADLLGEKHYVHNSLKAKEYYFHTLHKRTPDGSSLAPDKQVPTDMSLVFKGLSYEPDAPYLLLLLARAAVPDSIEFYVNRLSELAPNWAVWYRHMARKAQYQKRDPELALKLYRKAISIDSTFWSTLNWITEPLEELGKMEEARQYREQTVRTIYRNLAADTARRIPDELTVLGNALWRLRRYREAAGVLNAANRANDGFYIFAYSNLLPVLCDMGQYQAVLDSLEVVEKITGRTPFRDALGIVHGFFLGNYDKAEAAFDSANEAPEKPEADYSRTQLYIKTGRYAEAFARLDPDELFWKSTLCHLQGNEAEARRFADSLLLHVQVQHKKNNASLSDGYIEKAIAEYRTGRLKEMAQTIESAENALPGDGWMLYSVACVYAQCGQPDKAFHCLELAEKAGWHPNPILWLDGTVKDNYLNPLHADPRFAAWEKRWSPPYKDYSKN